MNLETAVNLETTADREAALLASYAMHSADSRGRKHAEPEHPYRGPFQRDRDRIVHASAFRRLSGKMQVFTGDMGDYHRTRLTHTHEVASIARTIGRALRLNEDLIEALALFHDIGHPPFGHAGEDALDECLRRPRRLLAQPLRADDRRGAGIALSGVSRAEPDVRSARRPGDAGRQGRSLCRRRRRAAAWRCRSSKRPTA